VEGHGRWDGAPPEPLTPAAMGFFDRPARPAAGGFRAMAVSPPAWLGPPHKVLSGVGPVELIVARTDQEMGAV
jgi:hypothetical protein